MVQRNGDVVSEQTTQSADQGDQRVTSQARDHAFGPQDRRTPGDHKGPDGTSHYHVDDQGRVNSLTNSSGETTKLTYADGSSQVQSYKVYDSQNQLMEQATRDRKSGTFSVDGHKYADVKVGRNNQLQLVDANKVSHERLLGGNSIRVDDRMPRATDGGRPVQAEVAPDGRTDYHWSTTQGDNGQNASRLDNYTVKDANNNIMELGVRRPDGRFLTYRPQPGEQGLNPADCDAITKSMANGTFPPLDANHKPVMDKNLDKDGIDCPTSVSVDKDGHRVERYVNGEVTRNTSGGDVYHTHVDGRHSQTVRLADGQPHLTYTETRDPASGEKRTEKFEYDPKNGSMTKYTEARQVYDQSGQPHVESHTYTRNGNQWIDESGKPAKFSVVDNRNGSVSIVDGDKMHNFNDDGSELFKHNRNSKWLVDREITSSGGDTQIKYDRDNRPSDVEYHWPGANGGQGVVEHLQRGRDDNGEYWRDTSVRGGAPHYVTADIDSEGTINYRQSNGYIVRQDDPRDLPRGQQPAQTPRYRGAQSLGYDPRQGQQVWNPTDDPSVGGGGFQPIQPRNTDPSAWKR